MKTNGGFLVTKIKQLGDRIFEKILSEKNIDAFNGAQAVSYTHLKLGSDFDSVADTVLQAGGEVVLAKVRSNLSSVVGRGDVYKRQRNSGQYVTF